MSGPVLSFLSVFHKKFNEMKTKRMNERSEKLRDVCGGQGEGGGCCVQWARVGRRGVEMRMMQKEGDEVREVMLMKVFREAVSYEYLLEKEAVLQRRQ